MLQTERREGWGGCVEEDVLRKGCVKEGRLCVKEERVCEKRENV